MTEKEINNLAIKLAGMAADKREGLIAQMPPKDVMKLRVVLKALGVWL